MANDKALLCGVNNYKEPSVPDLRGCINDTATMQRLLVDVFGFATSNVRILKDAAVTKEKIKANWKWLVKDAEPGDRLIFHFSGHGSQVPDEDGDEKEDDQDEILCLYDMDFDDPSTYLTDDEIALLRGDVPEGVLLTLFFDECHSGTAARVAVQRVNDVEQFVALDAAATTRRFERSTSRSARETAESVLEDPADPRAIRARFLPPPPNLRRSKSKGAKRKKTGSTGVESPYLSLSACQDDQTAADAFIDGAFHGAFTHGLAKVLTGDQSLSSKAVVTRVQNALSDAGFTQRPATGGVERAPVLGGGAGTPDRNDVDSRPVGSIEPVGCDGDLRTEIAELLEGVADKLRGGAGEKRLGVARAAGARHLVYVHGISQHLVGYSDPWWNSLRPFTTAFGDGELDETRHEVLWSDLVNARSLEGLGDREAVRKEEALRERIQDVIDDRARRETAQALQAARASGRELPRRSDRTLEVRSLTATRGGGFAIDDFLKYMTNNETRRRIIKRFTDKVKPLLESGATIDIISHSWGTVVVYEGLRELDGGFSGRVKSLFTAGSALSLPPVRSSLRPANRNGDKPAGVGRWINLDAQGDVIGGSLSDVFDVDQEELDLLPTGCKRSLWGWGPYGVVCAHGSYFVGENEYVNRVVFAGNINRP